MIITWPIAVVLCAMILATALAWWAHRWSQVRMYATWAHGDEQDKNRQFVKDDFERRVAEAERERKRLHEEGRRAN